MIARELFVQNGPLADRGVSAHYRWQQVEAGLVYEQDRPTFSYGPFLREGQRSSFQRFMTSSSGWLARRIGFCKLNPDSLTSRLTCAGW